MQADIQQCSYEQECNVYIQTISNVTLILYNSKKEKINGNIK